MGNTNGSDVISVIRHARAGALTKGRFSGYRSHVTEKPKCFCNRLGDVAPPSLLMTGVVCSVMTGVVCSLMSAPYPLELWLLIQGTSGQAPSPQAGPLMQVGPL